MGKGGGGGGAGRGRGGGEVVHKGKRTRGEEVECSQMVCSIWSPIQGPGSEKRKLSFVFKVCISDVTSLRLRVEGSQTEPSPAPPLHQLGTELVQNPTPAPHSWVGSERLVMFLGACVDSRTPTEFFHCLLMRQAADSLWGKICFNWAILFLLRIADRTFKRWPNWVLSPSNGPNVNQLNFLDFDLPPPPPHRLTFTYIKNGHTAFRRTSSWTKTQKVWHVAHRQVC